MANILDTPNEHAGTIPSLADQPNIKALLAPELPKLVAIETEFCRLRSLLGEHSHERLRAAHQNGQRELRDNPAKLTTESLDMAGADFSAKASEVAAKRSLIKAALAAFTRNEVIPAVLPLLQRAVTEGQKSQDRLEAAERDLYAPFGVAWVPSPLHRGLSLRLAEWRAKADQLERCGHVGYVSPSGLLTGILDPAELLEAAKPKGSKR